MKYHLEIAGKQLHKEGEELCGDSLEIAAADDSLVVVLSDGLGSGVKANILSSLTAKMASAMLREGLPLEEVINTLICTLPVCEVRRLAYSTFSILQVFQDGSAYLAEYDAPDAYWGRGDRLLNLQRHEREISGRVIKEAFFQLQEGDWLVMLTDGLLHAGIGGIWSLGWGAERIGKYIESMIAVEETAAAVAAEMIRVCEKLYGGKPGDDGTCVVVKVREKRFLTMMVGPPVNVRDDETVVKRLLSSRGKKVVCGGTTANIVARITGKQLTVDLDSMNDMIPPTGKIEGIDLVTEGMLTLSYTSELLRSNPDNAQIGKGKDGASRLAAALLEADDIRIFMGRAINTAHQSPDVPPHLVLKHKIIEGLVQLLEQRNKKVTVYYF